MKKNKTTNTYCLIEQNENYCNKMLVLLLTINLHNKKSNVIICCSKKTEKFLNNFPVNFKLNIEYLRSRNEDGYKYRINDLIDSLYYSINKFGEAVYLNENLIQVRNIFIPEKIKHQGFGLLQKIFNSHDEENNKKRFTCEIMYCNKTEIIDNIKKYYNTETSSNNELKNKFILFGHDFTKEYNYTNYFDNGYVISSEDFLSFSDSVTMNDISDELYFKKNNQIVFFNILHNSVHKKMIDIKNNLYTIIVKNNPTMYPLIHLKSCGKINFKIPYMPNIGIWNRKKYNPSFYNVIQGFCKNNKDLCNYSFVKEELYFSASNFLLLDFPSVEWLTPEVNKFRKILYCHHNDSLIKELTIQNKAKGFLFYYSDNIMISDDFFLKRYKSMIKKNKKRITEKAILRRNGNNYLLEGSQVRSYNVLLTKLINISYIIMDDFDMGLFITVMAAGCIPILQKNPKKMATLVEGKHYFVKNIPFYIDVEETRNNVIKYYKNNCKLDKCFKRLVRHLFVGDI